LEAQIKEIAASTRQAEAREALRRSETVQALKVEFKDQIRTLTLSLNSDDPEEKRTEGEEAGQSDVAFLKDVKRFQHLHLRVRNLERRLASLGDFSPQKEKRSTLSFTLDPSNASMADDFNHELHLKLVTVMNEANGLRELFKRVDEQAESLPSIGIPNFGSYVPYRERLHAIEEKIQSFAHHSQLHTVSQELAALRSMLRPPTPLPKPDPKPSPNDGLSAQVSELRLSLEDIRTSIRRLETAFQEGVYPVSPDAQSVTFPESDPALGRDMNIVQQALSQMQHSLSLRALRSELEPLMRPRQSVLSRPEPSKAALSLDAESRLESVEAKLGYYWEELNKVKSALMDRGKATDKLESQVMQTTAGLESNLQRLRIELKGQISDLVTMLDKQSDDPEALKNVLTLKVVMMKLQKDLRELNNRVDTMPREVQAQEVGTGGEKPVGLVARRIDSEVRALTQQFQSLSSEVAELKQVSKKQVEATAAAYLKHLEEVKTDVSFVLEKVHDGARLSQRDNDLISELFQLVETKGEKSALNDKANKDDLRKASQQLVKRINDLKTALQRLQSAQEDTRNQAREAFLTKGHASTECLSCGKEATAGREASLRVGPGFSRLLGYLGTLVEERQTGHARTRSELRGGAATERERPNRKVKLLLPQVGKRTKAEGTDP